MKKVFFILTIALLNMALFSCSVDSVADEEIGGTEQADGGGTQQIPDDDKGDDD